MRAVFSNGNWFFSKDWFSKASSLNSLPSKRVTSYNRNVSSQKVLFKPKVWTQALLKINLKVFIMTIKIENLKI
jgi:hypothetical protein